MRRRLPDRGRMNPDCTSDRHGHYAAYRHGCRCPHAREDDRIYAKRLREGRHTPKHIDGAGTRRRLRALAVLGWRWQDIGDRLGVSWQAAQALALRDHRRIHVNTAAAVKTVYRELCERPGPSRITARRAVAKSWRGPLAWADIDDPDAVPDDGGSNGPTVDDWAVTEALAGRMAPSRLADVDLAEAARRLLDDGLQPGQIRYRLGLSNSQTRRVLEAAR